MKLAELQARLAEIRSRLAAIDSEHGDAELPEDIQTEHEALNTEDRSVSDRISAVTARRDAQRARVDAIAAVGSTEVGDDIDDDDHEPVAPTRTRRADRRNEPNDVESVRSRVSAAPTDTARAAIWRDAALRAVDAEENFAHPSADPSVTKTHIEKLLRREAKQLGTARSEVAERILHTGTEEYQRAFAKAIAGQPQTPEEQRALATFTGSAGGFAVPYVLDPTLIPTSNSSVNPYRAISRVETILSNEWRGVTSGAITAAYAAEGTETSDNTPTLVQPTANPERCQAFVPFSMEIEGDWPSALQELAMLVSDAKDDVEASKYTSGAGHGSTEPEGITVGATTTTTAAGTASFAVADIYKVWEALPPRFRARAAWVANLATWDRIRQFDTAGGANLFMQNLQAGFSNEAPAPGSIGVPLLAKAAYECSAIDSVLTTGSKIAVVGDWRHFLIVDRVGLNVEIVQHLVGTNRRPTGQRGLLAIWRNTSKVLAPNAFRVLVTG